MPKKRKLSSLADRCRFCLARDACMSNLFVDWLKPKLQDIEKCSSVEVLDKPNYPKSICYVCLYKLEMWNEFKSQFLKTNKTIMLHLKCAEPSENEEDKSLNSQEMTNFNSDNNQKRPRIDINESQTIETIEKPNETSTEKLTTTQIPVNDETVENAVLDTLHSSNLEDNGIASITKIQPSDSSVTNSKKIGGRSRKIERVASTKRWEERKNALIAATGEVPSESDSDNGAQLSPVQKARARSNNEKELETQRRKLEKALKNLETNMTEKYRINQEDIIIDVERKTRSRKINLDDQKEKEFKTESSKLDENEKKLEPLIVDTKETDKKKDTKETSKSPVKETIKITVSNKESEQTVANDTEAMELSAVVNETENHLEISQITEEQGVKNNTEVENNTDAANVHNESMDVDSVVKESNKSFTPQLVSSEVSLGNATYVVTTTLDLPNSSSSKSDISLKTNGLNIDATSKDGQKVDLLNAIQLQHVKNGDESINKTNNSNNTTQSDTQKCLKIEIEGMEVEGLQRVQLGLAHFVKDEIRKRIVDEVPSKGKTDKKTTNFKDTYETLDHQLKSIIEKVLRTNFEADQNSEKSWSINNKKISLEFLKAAKQSHVFQPIVAISQLNISELSKTYQINNPHLLENVKRRVGPRSRTLGKRKHVLPKKYDGFSLSLKPEDDEKLLTMATKLVGSKPSTPMPVLTKTIEKISDASQNTSRLSLDFKDSVLRVNSETSHITEGSQESPEKVLISLASSQSVIEEKRTSSIVVRKSPIIKEISTEFSHDIVEVPDEAPVDFVKIPDKTFSLKPKESVKPYSIVLQSKANKTNKEKVNSPSSVTELSIIKSKPLPVIYPKPKDLPRPVITVVNSNKQIVPLPSIANRSTNADSTLPANKVAASPAKPPLPSLTNKTSTKNSTSVNSIQKSGKRQRHICGICGIELFSKEEAEAHVKNHTGEPTSTIKSKSNTNIEPTPLLQSTKPKPKLMRCKRCQAIVEARNVKTHVCDSVKYKCRLCDCSFGAEHLLVAHLETHTQIKEKPNVMKPPTAAIVKKNLAKDPQRMVITKESYRKAPEQREKDLEEMLPEKESQGYSCFVCDKVFVDEDQMKDHLQMHCEEVSDESNEKGFQCAFCGEKFQTEESLETHVGDHLLEDGDEKINMLISMGTRRDKQKKNLFKCEQCSETFNSSLLLAMHLPMHEEEEAATMIAEYEKQQEDAYTEHHVCVVCDEIFDTAEELSDHQDVHNGNVHVCILCEKPFSSIRDLQEHVSTHL